MLAVAALIGLLAALLPVAAAADDNTATSAAGVGANTI